MQIRPELSLEVGTAAYGLRLELDPDIEIPGMPQADPGRARACSVSRPGQVPHPSGARPPTRVRLNPEELARRWNCVDVAPERVRELRDGNATVFSVDLALPAGYLLHAPGYARILIAPDGTEMICDPDPRNSGWSALLAAQGLPLAATLQGCEVLHASGVVLGDKATLFVGPPGAGKSSLAAALLRRGATLLSDDTVALELTGGALIAHPGVAVLQLRDAEYHRLSAKERECLGHRELFMDKHRYTPKMIAPSTPLGALFLLEHGTRGPVLQSIEAVNPFALLASTFNLSVRTPSRLARHLDLMVALAATARIYCLRIRPDVDATQLAEIVRERLTEAT